MLETTMKTQCPILGRSTTIEHTSYSQGEWSIVQCTETGFVFLKDPPSYQRLESEFAWEMTAAKQTEARRHKHPLQKAISKGLSRIKTWLFPRRNRFFTLARQHMDLSSDAPVRILDIGCGGGELLMDLHQRFQQRGQTVIPNGIEISLQLAEAASQAVNSVGGKITQQSAIAGAREMAAESIDIAVMCSFLEHEAQPLELLITLRDALAPQGVIILKVPNYRCWNRSLRRANWPGFRFPDHVNYFTPETLSLLASVAGYSCRQTFLDTIPSSDNMYAVLQKLPVSAWQTSPSSRTARMAYDRANKPRYASFPA